MNKPRKQPADYPEHTTGSKLAEEARKMGNTLSDAKRASLFKRGMAMIYGGDAKQTTRTGR